MPTLNIKPTHKPIKNYYAELEAYTKIGAKHEGAVRTAFQTLLQHYCRTVFDNPDFTNRNIIAQEIEKVIHVLTQRSPSRSEFLRPLNPFYSAIEKTAATITDFSQKQSFLNTVYEQFFQGFSVKVADTHGIVYTPQPIVDFMVKSVEHVLKTEFGRSLCESRRAISRTPRHLRIPTRI